MNREKERQHKYYLKNKEKWREYSRNWRKKNPEKNKESNKKSRIKNLEKIKLRQKEYNLKNKERVNARSRAYNKAHAKEIKAYQDGWRDANREWFKKWRLENKHRCKAYKLKRRSLEKHLRSNLIKQVYDNNIKKNGVLTCVLCEKKIINDDTLEHLQPLSRGGSNEIDNLDIAHKICNFRKNNKTMEEWNQYKVIYA